MVRYMENYSWLMLMSLPVLLLIGCDVGINPLLFDGSPLERDFTINTTQTSFSSSETIDLDSVAANISQDIDSVKVFNITVRIENAGTTPASTTFSGTASFEGNTLATLSGVSLTTLSTERSIFNTTGITFNGAGVSALGNAINDAVHNSGGSPHTRTFAISMTASDSPVNIIIHVKVYTQVYTVSPNS